MGYLKSRGWLHVDTDVQDRNPNRISVPAPENLGCVRQRCGALAAAVKDVKCSKNIYSVCSVWCLKLECVLV